MRTERNTLQRRVAHRLAGFSAERRKKGFDIEDYARSMLSSKGASTR